MGKGHNLKISTLVPGKFFDWIQKFWPQASLSEHLMLS